MKKTTLITILTLLVTYQAHAAKIISGSSASANTSGQINNNNNVVAAAPAPTQSAPMQIPLPRQAAPTTTGIDTGIYMGVQLGDSSVGAVLGYLFTRMFGMEISYDYFDPLYTRAVTTTVAEKNRLGASAIFLFPVKFSDMGPMALYAKVGYARTTDKLTTDDPGLPPAIPASNFITTTTTTGVTGGAGVHVDVSKSATARLGVNVVGAERATYLAVLYRF